MNFNRKNNGIQVELSRGAKFEIINKKKQEKARQEAASFYTKRWSVKHDIVNSQNLIRSARWELWGLGIEMNWQNLA